MEIHGFNQNLGGWIMRKNRFVAAVLAAVLCGASALKAEDAVTRATPKKTPSDTAQQVPKPAPKPKAKKPAAKKRPAKNAVRPPSAQPGKLRIGWAMRDVSTDLPVIIPGGWTRPVSKGMTDRLTVTALVIDNGVDQVIFLSCDHVHLGGAQVRMIQNAVAKMEPKLPRDKWIVSSTHTHTGGALYGPGRHGVPEGMAFDEKAEFRAMFIRSAAEAIVEAWRKRAPGKIAWGYGFVVAGFSRRTVYKVDLNEISRLKHDPDSPVMRGHATMHGPNIPEFSHYEAGMDPFANYLFTFDKDDNLTGAIINLSTTAQCGNPDHDRLSADFWHEARQAFKAKYGDIYILPQCAAAGDITPRQQHYMKAQTRRLKLKYGDRSEHRVIRFRMDVADRILASFDEVLSWASKDKRSVLPICHTTIHPKLARAVYSPDDVAEAERHLEELEKTPPPENADPVARNRAQAYRATRRSKYMKVVKTAESVQKMPALETEIHIVRIGDIAFASNPFELFIDYMHRIQRQSPYELTFIVQLAQMSGAAGGYLPTERAVANRGYSAEPYSYSISPAGGDTLVEETVKELQRLYKIRWKRPASPKKAPPKKVPPKKSK